MRSITFLAVFATVSVATVSVATAEKAPSGVLPPGYDPLDRIRAIVDTQVITNYQLEKQFAPLSGEGYGILDPEERKQWFTDKKGQVLTQLIDAELILEEAQKLDLEIHSSEVEAHVNQLKAARKMDDAAFVEFLKTIGFDTIEAYRQHVEREMLKAQVIRLKAWTRARPSKDEVQRVFERDYHGGKKMDEVHAQHILIRLPQLVTAKQIEEKSERAHMVHKKVLAEEGTFEELAKQFSEDTNASSGGSLGWFGRCTLDPDFERHTFKLKPGQISPVVRTNFGFHIIRVLEKRAVPIEDKRTTSRLQRCVRMDLETANRVKAYESYTKELRVTHHVVEYP